MRAVALLALAACGHSGGSSDAACQRSILFLDRAGGAYDHGSFDSAAENLSVLLDGPRTLPPYPRDDAEWATTVSCIRDALTPLPIEVTETDPGTTPHVEIVFTTTYWGDPATNMVIPASCNPGHQIEFVFSDGLPPTYSRPCQMALLGYAEMTANLSPGDDCKDIVNLAMDCAPVRAFLDETSTCVDTSNQPVACRCGGTTQNVYQALAAAHPACP